MERLSRDPHILEELEKIVKAPKELLAFRVVWEHGPITGPDADHYGRNPDLHTYYPTFARAGWLRSHGKHPNKSNKSRGELWEISGEIGVALTKEKAAKRDKAKRNKQTLEEFDGTVIHINRKVVNSTSGSTRYRQSTVAEFYKDITNAFRLFYLQQLEGYGDLDELFAFVDLELAITQEFFQKRVERIKRQLRDNPSSERKKLELACKVLGVPFPGHVGPDTSAARKRKKELAHTYHPDVSKTNTADKLQLIVESFDLIEHYATEELQKHLRR